MSWKGVLCGGKTTDAQKQTPVGDTYPAAMLEGPGSMRSSMLKRLQRFAQRGRRMRWEGPE